MSTTRPGQRWLKRWHRAAPAVGALLLTGLLLWWHLPAVPRAVRRNGPTPAENLVALAPDGRWAATVDRLPSFGGLSQSPAVIRVWDTDGRGDEPRQRFELPDLWLSATGQEVVAAADGRALVAGLGNGKVALLHLEDGRSTLLTGVRDRCLSPDGRRLALVMSEGGDEPGQGDRQSLRVLDPGSGRVTAEVRWGAAQAPVPPPVIEPWFRSLWFTPDSRWLGFVVHEGEGRWRFVVWDLAAGHAGWQHPATAWEAYAVAADGRTLAVLERAEPQRLIKVFDLPAGRETARFPLAERISCLGLHLAADGSALTATCVEMVMGGSLMEPQQRLITWALPTGEMRLDALIPDAAFMVGPSYWDHPRRYLLRQAADGPREAVEVATGRARATLTGVNPVGLTWSPDGRWLVVREIRTPPPFLVAVRTWLAARGLWPAPGTGEWYHALDLETGRPVPGLAGPCGDWRFAPGGQFLATRDADGAILVWELPPPRPWGWIVLGALTGVIVLQLAGAAFRAWRRRRRGTEG